MGTARALAEANTVAPIAAVTAQKAVTDPFSRIAVSHSPRVDRIIPAVLIHPLHEPVIATYRPTRAVHGPVNRAARIPGFKWPTP